jgi:preprotein translocase subunit SecE
MLEIYKSGQGKWGRYLAAASVGALVIYGCYSLYEYLNVGTLKQVMLFPIPGVEVDVNLPFLISFGIFLALAMTIYVMLNKPKVGDFLIETELEMKKISWPGRSELVGSSTIVIVVVVILALVIMLFDFVVQFFLRILTRV